MATPDVHPDWCKPEICTVHHDLTTSGVTPTHATHVAMPDVVDADNGEVVVMAAGVVGRTGQTDGGVHVTFGPKGAEADVVWAYCRLDAYQALELARALTDAAWTVARMG